MVKINSKSTLFNNFLSVYFNNAFGQELPIILCIGSERATGDALAPLVGTLLRTKHNVPTYVYGTLETSVNAKNVEEYYQFIKAHHPGKKILAIDACVGAEEDIGFVKLTNTGLAPRSAIEKTNLSFGDYSLLAIVDKQFSDPLSIFTTRLSVVFELSKKIAAAISDWANLFAPPANLCQSKNSEQKNAESALSV